MKRPLRHALTIGVGAAGLLVATTAATAQPANVSKTVFAGATPVKPKAGLPGLRASALSPALKLNRVPASYRVGTTKTPPGRPIMRVYSPGVRNARVPVVVALTGATRVTAGQNTRIVAQFMPRKGYTIRNAKLTAIGFTANRGKPRVVRRSAVVTSGKVITTVIQGVPNANRVIVRLEYTLPGSRRVRTLNTLITTKREPAPKPATPAPKPVTPTPDPEPVDPPDVDVTGPPATGLEAITTGGHDTAPAGQTAPEGHTCALRTGKVFCWGSDYSGQLGDGGSTAFRRTMAAVQGLDGATKVTAGGLHTCAIRGTGEVVCWGDNVVGQVGNEGVPIGLHGHTPVPVGVPGLVDATDVSAGTGHTCAIRTGGQVVCWGDNEYGQLGPEEHGPGKFSATWQPVAGVTDAIQISSGYSLTCAIRTGGQVVCWGEGTGGVPTPVEGLDDAVQVSSGTRYMCAIRTSGQVECWGADAPLTLTPLAGLDNATSIAAGNGRACAIRATGQAECWGADDATPTPTGLDDVKSIDTARHTCAVRTTGQAVCWGPNDFGQLGDGTRTFKGSPVPVIEP